MATGKLSNGTTVFTPKTTTTAKSKFDWSSLVSGLAGCVSNIATGYFAAKFANKTNDAALKAEQQKQDIENLENEIASGAPQQESAGSSNNTMIIVAVIAVVAVIAFVALKNK